MMNASCSHLGLRKPNVYALAEENHLLLPMPLTSRVTKRNSLVKNKGTGLVTIMTTPKIMRAIAAPFGSS